MDKTSVFFGKIIVAQIVAFFISTYLIQNVFVGPIPEIRPDFKEEVKSLPQTIPQIIIDNVKKIPEMIEKTPEIVQRKPQNGIRLPPPWVPAPSSIPPESGPNPTNPPQQPPPQQPTVTPIQQPDTRPSPTPLFRLPTAFQRPTSIPTRPQIPTPTQTSSRQVPPPQGDVSLEQGMLNEINRRRREEGIHELTINQQLTAAARRHSADMGSKKFCDHKGSDNSLPPDRVRDAGYSGGFRGEDVGCGFRTAVAVVDGWWQSPGHHAVLVDRSARYIGLGWSNNYQTAVTGN